MLTIHDELWVDLAILDVLETIETGNAARLQRRSQYQWTCSQCGAAQTLLEATTAEGLRCLECAASLRLEEGGQESC